MNNLGRGRGGGRGTGRGLGRGGDVNRPAWMTGGVSVSTVGGSGRGRGRGRRPDEASLAAAAIVRSVVTNPPPSAISRTDDQEGGGGRGRGRGRGTDNRPAWMTTGRTEHGSRSVTATDSGGSRDKFCVDLNRLSSQIYLEERRRLENEKRRLEKVERVRKEDEEMKRLEEESKRVEEARERAAQEAKALKEEREHREAEELRQLEELADKGLFGNGNEGSDDVNDFEDEKDREASLARKKRERRRRRLEEVGRERFDSDAKKRRAEQADKGGDLILTATMSEETMLELGTDSADFAGKVDSNETPASFDMFASSPSPVSKSSTKGRAMESSKTSDSSHKTGFGEIRTSVDAADSSNHDDAEGYYRATIGEVLDLGTETNERKGGTVRLKILGVIGKGVFSTVLKAVPVGKGEEHVLAIKLIRNNETMAKAAVKEVRILRLLCSSREMNAEGDCGSNRKDDEEKQNYNIVRLLEITANGIDFDGRHDVHSLHQKASSLPPLEYRNHTILLFEHLPYNLRETLAKFGKGVGISLAATRSYARQLFRALQHLAKHRVVHADIKPDNILVSSDFSTVKLCDFGSAFFETDSDNIPTPYLVSRFYRAPEIILGLDYDIAVDLWSVAVTCAELFTGLVLFPGRTNNDMLRRFVDAIGPFSNRILRRHCASYGKMGLPPNFEAVPGGSYSFRRQEVDKVSGKPVIKIVPKMETNPLKQLTSVVLKSRSTSDDRTDVLNFATFLSRCLALDPARRIGVKEVFEQEFFHHRRKLKRNEDEVATRKQA